jgi:hypothetical protein
LKRAALTTCAALAACNSFYDPCFSPASVVNDLRILAVRADPPEALYDPVSFVAPPVSLRALVVFPGGSSEQLVHLRACVPQPMGPCPPDQPWEVTAAGSSDMQLQVAPEKIRAALQADPLAGYGGVRVQVEVLVENGNASVSASKLVLFSPALPGYVPNHSFSVTGFALSGSGGDRVVADQGLIELPVPETVWLRPLLSPGAQETYQVTDLAGRTIQLTERISYSFFTLPHAQYGPLGRPVAGSDVADEPAPGDPVPERGLVTLTALSAATGRLWVVARDGRGGEAWAGLAVQMPDRRNCSFDFRCPLLDFGCL